MQCARNSGAQLRLAAIIVALASPFALAGCGMPAAPQPPSLHLPAPVSDLSAVRTGSQVALAWTMPRKDTEKVLLKGGVTVHICRTESTAANCSKVAEVQLAPGASSAFTDTLPLSLTAGAPRVVTYFVELNNSKGRSAGLSNDAQVLAGEAPSAIDGLDAEMRRNGVLLRWTPAPVETAPVAVRFVRKRIAEPASKPAASRTAEGPFAPPPEPPERTLLVPPAPHLDRALDSSIEFGATYEYRAQRVTHATIDGKTLELAGPLSAPVRIVAVNVYPPRAPRGLAAVATAGTEGSGPAIDLNWQPNTEDDLAGYIVYRRDANETAIAWQRISPSQPVVGPAYHDANVQPGHTYAYAVSAVDEQGHESARSPEAEETAPAP
jgi:hypothetical protein